MPPPVRALFVDPTTLTSIYKKHNKGTQNTMLKLYDASNIWCLVNKQIKDFLNLVLEAQK